MTPLRIAAAAAAAALALAGTAPAGAAGTPEFPTLKSGQWEITAKPGTPGAAPRKSTICLDASTQKAMLDMSVGMQKEMCSKMDMRHDGAKYVTDAECRLGGSIVKSHSVMTMLGETAYHTESSATFDPPFNNMRESSSVIDGKYVGACRDGLVPGDVVTANGQKINLRNLPPRPPPPPPPPPPPAQGK
jgi:hypothetical protein